MPQRYLVVQGRAQLEHSSHIVKVGVEANTSSTDVYWKKWLNWQIHLELCHRNPEILKRVLNWIALSNSTAMKCAPMQVITKNRTWENFNSRETKMTLLSDEIWLIANNFKSFANGSKLIIRNNIGLCKHPEIYLI